MTMIRRDGRGGRASLFCCCLVVLVLRWLLLLLLLLLLTLTLETTTTTTGGSGFVFVGEIEILRGGSHLKYCINKGQASTTKYIMQSVFRIPSATEVMDRMC